MDTSYIEDKIGLSCRFDAARKANLAKRAKKRLPSLEAIDNAQIIINDSVNAKVKKAFSQFKQRAIKRAITGKRQGLEGAVLQNIVRKLYAIDWK